MARSNLLFDVLNNVTLVKNKSFLDNVDDSELKKLNPFILNKWISMNPGTMIFADVMNEYSFSLTTEQYYNIALNILPMRKVFFRWIGKDKNNKNEKVQDFLVNMITNEYEFISKKEAKEYLIVLQNNNTLHSILKKYPITDEQLKTLGLKREDLFGKQVVTKEKVIKKVEKKPENEMEDLFC